MLAAVKSQCKGKKTFWQQIQTAFLYGSYFIKGKEISIAIITHNASYFSKVFFHQLRKKKKIAYLLPIYRQTKGKLKTK